MVNITDAVEWVEKFNGVYMPFVIFIGFVGNTMAILVFLCTRQRRIPSSHYLCALAFSDTGVLMCQLCMRFQLGFHQPSTAFCVIFFYAMYISSFLSVYFVLAFTCERFIAVCFPLHRHIWCTVETTIRIVACLVFTAALFNVYLLFVMYSNGDQCSLRDGNIYMRVFKTFNTIDTIATAFLPILSIIILNCFIAHRLMQSIRFAGGKHHGGQAHRPDTSAATVVAATSLLRGSPSPTAASTRAKRLPRQESKQRQLRRTAAAHKERKITQMLLVVSVVFVALNLPDHMVRIVIIQNQNSTIHEDRILELVQSLTSPWFYTGFAINFFLYSIVGANFRSSLKLLIFQIIDIVSLGRITKIKTYMAHIKRCDAGATKVNSTVPAMSSGSAGSLRNRDKRVLHDKVIHHIGEIDTDALVIEMTPIDDSICDIDHESEKH